jgi:hypothetical protein
LEYTAEGFAKYIELVLDVELPWQIKDLIKQAIANAYAYQNYAFIQYVNNSIATIPRIRSLDTSTLYAWRAQFRPQFLAQLQSAYMQDPLAKAIIDYYSSASQQAPGQPPKSGFIGTQSQEGFFGSGSGGSIIGTWVSQGKRLYNTILSRGIFVCWWL